MTKYLKLLFIFLFLLPEFHFFNFSEDNFYDPFRKFIDNIISGFESFLQSIKISIVKLFRIIYNLMALIGVIFYFTGFNKYSGRNLIISAIILAFICEFMVSYI
ncbi:MAG: hypothetical protein QXF09_03320 [Nitrososphaerota archaeon]